MQESEVTQFEQFKNTKKWQNAKKSWFNYYYCAIAVHTRTRKSVITLIALYNKCHEIEHNDTV